MKCTYNSNQQLEDVGFIIFVRTWP